MNKDQTLLEIKAAIVAMHDSNWTLLFSSMVHKVGLMPTV